MDGTTQAPVIVPEIRVEANREMYVSLWFAEEGDEVIEGDRLVEILAGSITFDVPAPSNGRLVRIHKNEEDAVHSGDILALVVTDQTTED